MRCVICDVNDQGLSLFGSDRVYASHFHVGTDGDYYCSECYDAISEAESDFNLIDEGDEE